jgi:hypothetical protein
MINAMNKSNLGTKGLFKFTTLVSNCVSKETEGRYSRQEPIVRNGSRDHKCTLLAQSAFLYKLRTTSPEPGPGPGPGTFQMF